MNEKDLMAQAEMHICLRNTCSDCPLYNCENLIQINEGHYTTEFRDKLYDTFLELYPEHELASEIAAAMNTKPLDISSTEIMELLQ